jgi:hypothetical protein
MMPRTLTRLSVFCLALSWQAALWAQASPLPQASTAQQIAAKTPATVRTPEELIVALGRCAKPDWTSKYLPPIATAPSSRAQAALLLGSMFADGYLAAQAEDAQHCRNVGKDLLTMAKTLGVQTELLDRSRSLSDSAQKKDWSLLRRELEATESDLAKALRNHDDAGLVHLITFGAWVRASEIVASALKDSYSENTALLLRQPVLNTLLQTGFEPLNDKLRSDVLLTLIQPRLASVAQLLGGPTDNTLSREEVDTLAATLASILHDITTR